MAIYFVVVILSAMMKRLVLKAFYAGTDHTIMVVSHWYKTMIPGQFTGGTNPFHMTSTSKMEETTTEGAMSSNVLGYQGKKASNVLVYQGKKGSRVAKIA